MTNKQILNREIIELINKNNLLQTSDLIFDLKLLVFSWIISSQMDTSVAEEAEIFFSNYVNGVSLNEE